MSDALIIELSERDAVLNSSQLKNQFSSLQIIGIVDGNIQILIPVFSLSRLKKLILKFYSV